MAQLASVRRLVAHARASRPARAALGISTALLAAAALAVVAFGWDWTGLPASTQTTRATEVTQGSTKRTQAVQELPAKTLWDALQLLGVLAIPVVVGVGAAWYTQRQQQSADAIATDDQHERALQAYIDKMSELLLANGMRESKDGDEVRTIARVRTLTALHTLDLGRRRSVLQFLYEAKLIAAEGRVIDLSNADLAGLDLAGIELRLADLSGAVLTGCNLRGASLYDSNLSRATLDGCELGDTGLIGADLSAASLLGAHFGAAVLSGTNFISAKLTGADLRGTSWGPIELGAHPIGAALLNSAELELADLTGADLNHVNLNAARLSGAMLVGCDLRGANLIAADLDGADLTRANLHGADLTNANLRSANLTGAIDPELQRALFLEGATLPDGTVRAEADAPVWGRVLGPKE